MLDKQTTSLLQNLNQICGDGSYKVLEKEDLITKMPKKYKTDFDGLKLMIDHLQERNYLSVKYSDDKVYCLTVLPKGKLFEEKSEEIKNDKKKYNRLILTTLLLSTITAFIGSFFAIVVSKFIF